MKTVLFVRHAKSSWGNFSMSDADRPLNERGKRNAPEMAKRLLNKGVTIDAFLSSPATRAYTTAVLFAQEFEIDSAKIIVIPELYMAGNEVFNRVIAEASAAADTIAVFSHNHGITDFVNSLTEIKVDNMPTCSIFAVSADIENWKDFSAADKKFLFFDYPKMA